MVCYHLAKLLGFKKFIDPSHHQKKETRLPIESNLQNSSQLFEKSEINFDSKFLEKLRDIEKAVQKIAAEMEQYDEKQDQIVKYKFAAIVMDRFFFFLQILYFIITFIAFVLSIKNFWKFY